MKLKLMAVVTAPTIYTASFATASDLVGAAKNIALEAQRLIAAGIAGTANRGTVSQVRGRKSSVLARAIEVRSPVL